MANAKEKSADRIVEAFIAYTNASWMETLVEVRTSEPKTDHTAEVVAGFAIAVDKGRLDAGSAKVYASQVRSIYMVPTSTFIDIVGQTGGAINATMRLVAAWKREAGLGSKAGRKTGQGAGKTTKPVEVEPDGGTLPEISLPKEWLRFLEGMRAKVPGFKTWTASDIAAFQDSSAQLIALIKRNTAF